MKKVIITVHADEKVGAWTMPEHMLDIVNRFMEALMVGNERHIEWHDGDADGWTVQPKLHVLSNQWIAAIKIVRAYYGVNLKDGKTMVDRARSGDFALPPLTYASALCLRSEMEEVGHRVELPSVLDRMAKVLGSVS